jgi:hypothetical protein
MKRCVSLLEKLRVEMLRRRVMTGRLRKLDQFQKTKELRKPMFHCNLTKNS